MQTLIELESPSADLEACAAVVAAANEMLLQHLGSKGRVINVSGRDHLWWGVEEPKVLVLGHLDTVWPIGTITEIPFAINGDALTGPGCVDMKSGVVQGIHAIAQVENAQVALLLTTDEEIGSETSRKLIETAAANAAAVLVLECAQNEALKTARKGTSNYEIVAHGLAAHAGLEPEKGINAGLAISEIALSVSRISNSELGTTVTPTVIRAGTTTNTVPAQAQLSIDVRAWSQSEQQRVDTEIRAIQSSIPGIKIEVLGGINRPPMESKMSLDLFKLAQQLAPEIGIPNLECAEVGGASDGNFTAALGVPTIDGLGAVGAGSHARTEWVSVSAIVPRINLLSEMITQLLKSK
jgi:glutamate carboxypeptidase